MEAEVLGKFLKHLMSCTETLLQKEEIDSYDVTSLRRELAQLKRNIDGKEKVDPRVLAKIMELELRVDEGLLEDSKRSTFFAFLKLAFHRSPLLAVERTRRMETLKRQITQFRDDLDHLRFSLEF